MARSTLVGRRFIPIFGPLGLAGLRTVDGAERQPLGDWNDANQAFGDVVRATETLISEHFFGPFTLVAGPLLYAQLNRVFGNSGLLTIEHIEKLLRGGFRCLRNRRGGATWRTGSR